MQSDGFYCKRTEKLPLCAWQFANTLYANKVTLCPEYD